MDSKKIMQTLQRTAFTTNRTLEFFSEKELTMQIGHNRTAWPIALVKELIDNALDACESAGIAPEITITLAADSVTVQDNGPGLPLTTLQKSLDYLVRISDKSHYVSPTRGQLGNALKCVWAAPFVINGEYGRIDVAAHGVCHCIEVGLDRIAQQPRITHTQQPSIVKNGTSVRMHWPKIACYLLAEQGYTFYNVQSIYSVLTAYAACNPHATFTMHAIGHDTRTWARTAEGWEKWTASDKTSPHWYTAERLRALIAGYLADEQSGGKVRTVREFVSEFNGLSGSAKPRQVLEITGLTGMYLHDLIVQQDVPSSQCEALLAAMQDVARPIKPQALGTLGQAHIVDHMSARRFVDADSVRYKKIEGIANGLPFVVEVAFGINRAEYEGYSSDVTIGLNWTPALHRAPIRELHALLGEQRIDSDDPVVLVVHVACPRFDFIDRGKSSLALPMELRAALQRAVCDVTKEWKRAKQQADQSNRVRARKLDELRKQQRKMEYSIKEAAYAVMEAAYMEASAQNTLPATARQVMYAARPRVLALTGGKCWEDTDYFTQTLLPDYLDEYSERTSTWDVVFDARGHFIEPHTTHRVDLGTIAVRDYMSNWQTSITTDIDPTHPHEAPTYGPAHRYKYALFIEKEGFNELFKKAEIAERYDIAIMSTKGMSVTAARTLIERLSENGVTILVLHDFDKSGLSILHTLRNDTRRYSYKKPPRMIDLGLRLDDVRALGLTSEYVTYRGTTDPRINLRESGATNEECAFLVRSRGAPWHGERVELNALPSDRFITWLTQKLDDLGVQKVVPSGEELTKAYQRAWRIATVNKAIQRVLDELPNDDVVVPDDLETDMRANLHGATHAWDEELWFLVQQHQARVA